MTAATTVVTRPGSRAPRQPRRSEPGSACAGKTTLTSKPFRARRGSGFRSEPDPEPLEQTFDKRFVQKPRSPAGGAGSVVRWRFRRGRQCASRPRPVRRKAEARASRIHCRHPWATSGPTPFTAVAAKWWRRGGGDVVATAGRRGGRWWFGGGGGGQRRRRRLCNGGGRRGR